MESRKILVVGATGMTGRPICERLRSRAISVRALVRAGAEGEARLRELGCEIVQGDLKVQESLVEACRGVTTVITTANSALSRRKGDSIQSVDRHGSLALVAAAERAGVRHFIYTSASPVLPADNDFILAKRAVEAALRSSAMTWTILQPARFMEIHTGPIGGWDFVNARARVVGQGLAPASYVSLHDVAGFAALAVSSPAAANRALHLVGPEPLSALDAVRIAERVTGRRFTVQRVPAALLRLLSVAVRPFNPVLSALLRMAVAEGADTTDMAPILRDLPIEQTTFEQHVRRQLGS